MATTQQDGPIDTAVTRGKPRRYIWAVAALATVGIVLAGVLTTQHYANAAPEDLDGLAATDTRFDPQNRGLHAHAAQQTETGWRIEAGWSGEHVISSAATTIDTWTDGGATLAVDDTSYHLAGVTPGVCSQYGTDLMSWLTKDHDVLIEPIRDGTEAIVWILNENDDGHTTAQLANALAIRFGAGHGLDADPALAISGILADESSSPGDQWRPETAACMGRD